MVTDRLSLGGEGLKTGELGLSERRKNEMGNVCHLGSESVWVREMNN